MRKKIKSGPTQIVLIVGHCATWPRQKLNFYLAHSIVKMEDSKMYQNDRTVILPPLEGTYLFKLA